EPVAVDVAGRPHALARATVFHRFVVGQRETAVARLDVGEVDALEIFAAEPAVGPAAALAEGPALVARATGRLLGEHADVGEAIAVDVADDLDVGDRLGARLFDTKATTRVDLGVEAAFARVRVSPDHDGRRRAHEREVGDAIPVDVAPAGLEVVLAVSR